MALNNPYPCSCVIDIVGSDTIVLEEKDIKIEAYGHRVVLFKLGKWNGGSLYIFLVDQRGNVCQTVEVIGKVPAIRLSDDL